MIRAQVLPRLLRSGTLHDALLRRMLGLGCASPACDQPPPTRRLSGAVLAAKRLYRS